MVRVAQDGSGDYCTVQDAIDSVPLENTCRAVICLSPGIYRQPVRLESSGRERLGAGLLLLKVKTLLHRALPLRTLLRKSLQTVVLFITVGFSAGRFTQSSSSLLQTLKRQDTLYLHHGKQYLKDCYVEGSVVFILGNSTTLLEHCHIHCKSQGFITAQSRKTSQESTGYVFLRSQWF
ncbi:unnamed protein product, partial [Thlaspi arvense]